MFDDNFLIFRVFSFCDYKNVLILQKVCRLYHQLGCESLLKHHSLVANNKKFWTKIKTQTINHQPFQTNDKQIFINDALLSFIINAESSEWHLKNHLNNDVIKLTTLPDGIEHLVAIYEAETNVIHCFHHVIPDVVHHLIMTPSLEIKFVNGTQIHIKDINSTRNHISSRMGPLFRNLIDFSPLTPIQNKKSAYMYNNIRIPYQELPHLWCNTIAQYTTGWTARDKQSVVTCNYCYFCLDVFLPKSLSKIRITFLDGAKFYDMNQIRLYGKVCLVLRFVTKENRYYTLFVNSKQIGKVDDFVFIDLIINQLYLSDGGPLTQIESFDRDRYDFIKL